MSIRSNGSGVATGIRLAGPDVDEVRAAAPPPKLRRNPWRAFLGALLVGGSGLAVWFLVTSGSTTTDVVAVASPVDRGQVVTAADLTVAAINPDPNLATVPAADLPDLVGLRASSDLPAGSLLTPGTLADTLIPPAGAALVGVTLTPAQLPAEPLRPGDAIRLVATPRAGDDLPGGDPTVFDATVIAVTALEETAQTTVDVQVGEDLAAQVAALAGTGRVAVILDSREP